MTLGTHTYNDMCTYHKPLPIFGADEIEIFRNGNNPTWYIDQCTLYYNSLSQYGRGWDCAKATKRTPTLTEGV